jgi:hypothetical protein
MFRRYILLWLASAVVLGDGAVVHGRLQTDPAIADDDRRAFEFLVGRWRLEERVDHVKKTSERGGNDIYDFKQALPSGAISATWHFNRRTAADPDYTDALYISGYHNSSKRWSFYYLSEQSAQYWPGEKMSGVWYFAFETTVDGKPWKQRQWWEPVSREMIKRHFDNWDFQRRTWTPTATAVLVRQPIPE